jgi:hypothetical protein
LRDLACRPKLPVSGGVHLHAARYGGSFAGTGAKDSGEGSRAESDGRSPSVEAWTLAEPPRPSVSEGWRRGEESNSLTANFQDGDGVRLLARSFCDSPTSDCSSVSWRPRACARIASRRGNIVATLIRFDDQPVGAAPLVIPSLVLFHLSSLFAFSDRCERSALRIPS